MKLVGDMHIHTNVSDHAFSTLSEMCKAAAEYGLKTIAMTNHAPCFPDSAHVMHFESIIELPRYINGVLVLRGAEVNILNPNGDIDLPEKILSQLDFVIASFHSSTFLDPTYEKCTKALECVLHNQYINLFGHLGTPAFCFDYEHIISQCNKFKKVIELNGSSVDSRPGSRSNCVEIALLCKKYNVPVMINSDSHFSANYSLSNLAVSIAEEAGLPEELVINSNWNRLSEYIFRQCGVNSQEKENAQ